MATSHRSKFVARLATFLGIALLVVGGFMYLAGPVQDRSIIRQATAKRLHVREGQVDVTSFVSRGSCFVAQVVVDAPGEPAYSVAVRDRPGPVVTRISGGSLGATGDSSFDTDDPRWEPGCLTR